MKQRDCLDGIGVFVAVTEAGSFSEAARRLGISPSAVSQAIRGLEERIGASLLRRSTRSLSLTDVGEDYLRAAAPALAALRQATEDASGRGGRPSGPLRLTMARSPFDLVIAAALVKFQGIYPDVDLEIAVEARMADITKEGFDAGLRYGNCLQKDMVAVQVAPRSEALLAASPIYLRERGAPREPSDLFAHRAIMCRSQINGLIIPWALHSAGDVVQMTPRAVTIVHDLASQIDLARRGLGIVSAPLGSLAGALDTGSLVRVLPDWSAPLEPLFVYFPSRRHQSAALRAFIEFLTSRPAFGDRQDAHLPTGTGRGSGRTCSDES